LLTQAAQGMSSRPHAAAIPQLRERLIKAKLRQSSAPSPDHAEDAGRAGKVVDQAKLLKLGKEQEMLKCRNDTDVLKPWRTTHGQRGKEPEGLPGVGAAKFAHGATEKALAVVIKSVSGKGTHR
jgi:hypothetical protein